MKNVSFVLKMTVFQGFVDMIVHLFSLHTLPFTLCLTSILDVSLIFFCLSISVSPRSLSSHFLFSLKSLTECHFCYFCLLHLLSFTFMFFSFSSSFTNCCTVLCLPLYLFLGRFISLYLEVFLKFYLPIHFPHD